MQSTRWSLSGLVLLSALAGATEAPDPTFMLPIIARAEETGFQAGLLLLHYLESKPELSRDSRLQGIALITEEQQYLVALTSNLQFDSQRSTVNLNTRLWPSTFYGIGPDSDLQDEYEISGQKLVIRHEFNVVRDWWLGPVIQLEQNDVEVQDDNTALNEDSDDRTAGLGFALAQDRRDDAQYPSSGSLFTLRSLSFLDSLGSDFDYQSNELGYSRYYPIDYATSIALSLQLNSQHGDIPFWDLNTPDGSNLLRGIERGRYRDKSLLGLQAAYRWKFSDRFGLVFFTEFAQVANKLSSFESDEFINSTGFGVRWQMIPGQSLNLRADISYVDGGSGFVINVGEAF